MRDYLGEAAVLITEAKETVPDNRRVAAARLVERLRAEDPELLAGWLDVQAEQLMFKCWWCPRQDSNKTKYTGRRGNAYLWTTTGPAPR
jgi:hypothetical protein